MCDPEKAFRFVRHGNPEFLIPNDGSTIVVAKVQGRTSNGSVLVGALDNNELQAHFAKYESCPHKLNYKWRARPCSYLVRRSPDPTDPVVSSSQFHFYGMSASCNDVFLCSIIGHKPVFEVRGMSHCWCGNPRTDFDFDVSGSKHILLSICHPVDPLLNRQHEVQGAIPSCEFTQQFVDLMPSWHHICRKFTVKFDWGWT